MSAEAPTTGRRALQRTITTRALSKLAARRPHVFRVRAVHAGEDPALVYIGYPEDTAGGDLPVMISHLATLVSATTDQVFDRPTQHVGTRHRPVKVHLFSDGIEMPGSAIEVFLDLSNWATPHLEVCLDGMECTAEDLDWMVDALAAAAAQLAAAEEAPDAEPVA